MTGFELLLLTLQWGIPTGIAVKLAHDYQLEPQYCAIFGTVFGFLPVLITIRYSGVAWGILFVPLQFVFLSLPAMMVTLLTLQKWIEKNETKAARAALENETKAIAAHARNPDLIPNENDFVKNIVQ
jgi:hypothetical protein